jgi:hypothetical protein
LLLKDVFDNMTIQTNYKYTFIIDNYYFCI